MHGAFPKRLRSWAKLVVHLTAPDLGRSGVKRVVNAIAAHCFCGDPLDWEAAKLPAAAVPLVSAAVQRLLSSCAREVGGDRVVLCELPVIFKAGAF